MRKRIQREWWLPELGLGVARCDFAAIEASEVQELVQILYHSRTLLLTGVVLFAVLSLLLVGNRQPLLQFQEIRALRSDGKGICT